MNNINFSILLWICFSVTHFLGAQEDVMESIEAKAQVVDDSIQIIYLDNYYAVYQNISPTRWGFYVNMISGDNRLAPGELGGLIPINGFGLEHVIGKRLSAYAAFNLYDHFFVDNQLVTQMTLSLSGRYFFKTSKDRLLQRLQNNLTGPFIELGYFRKIDDTQDDGQGFRLSGGWQNRIFKHGFYQLALELSGIYGLKRRRFELTPDPSIGTEVIDEYGWIFRLLPRINMGIAMGSKTNRLPNCAILSCHQEKQFLLKWNFLTLFPVPGQLQSTSIEFEFRNDNTSLSMVQGISYRFFNDLYSNVSGQTPAFRTHAGALRLFIEPRFYYDLQKRMLRGDAGSGFSANFIGLEISSERGSFSIVQEKEILQRSKIGFTSLFLSHGWQREFGRNFWLQGRLGLVYTIGDLLYIDQRRILSSNLIRPAADFKIGIYI